MNNDRRKRLDAIKERIAVALTAIEAVPDLDSIKDDLDTIKEEEQDAFDAMPDSLKEGEKGQDVQTCIDTLDNSVNELEQSADKIVEIKDSLQSAMDNIDEAMG